MDQCLFCANFLADVEDEEGLGQCRRYPPVVIQDEDGPYSTFPLVTETEVCGEFRRRVN